MPGLRCEVASAETVLVLKCLAHRLGEDDDVVLLAAQLGLDTADDVLDLIEQVGPGCAPSHRPVERNWPRRPGRR